MERVAGKPVEFLAIIELFFRRIVNFQMLLYDNSFLGGVVACLLAFFLIMIVIRTLILEIQHLAAFYGVDYSFLGGFQLLTIGILGKYIGKIFMETKKTNLRLKRRASRKQIFLLFDIMIR